MGGSIVTGIGNTMNNLIIGNSANNQLKGDSGRTDTLQRRPGDDTYAVDHTGDTVTESGRRRQ